MVRLYMVKEEREDRLMDIQAILPCALSTLIPGGLEEIWINPERIDFVCDGCYWIGPTDRDFESMCLVSIGGSLFRIKGECAQSFLRYLYKEEAEEDIIAWDAKREKGELWP